MTIWSGFWELFAAHLWTAVSSGCRNNFVSKAVAFLASAIWVLTKCLLCSSPTGTAEPTGCLEASPLSFVHARTAVRACLWFQVQTRRSKQIIAPAASETLLIAHHLWQVGFPPFRSFACSAFWEFSWSWEKRWIGVLRTVLQEKKCQRQ